MAIIRYLTHHIYILIFLILLLYLKLIYLFLLLYLHLYPSIICHNTAFILIIYILILISFFYYIQYPYPFFNKVIGYLDPLFFYLQICRRSLQLYSLFYWLFLHFFLINLSFNSASKRFSLTPGQRYHLWPSIKAFVYS